MKYDVVNIEGDDSDSDSTLIYIDGELKEFSNKGECENIARALRPDATFYYKKMGNHDNYPKKLADLLKWK